MAPDRRATLARLANETFDTVVVGGGATGAAIARDAAWRGLRVALVDRGDWAGQTSSHSSKLIHGGLRYLEHGDLALVFEALADRDRLRRAAPHLCQPVDFVVPGYRNQKPGHTLIGIGIRLYNALALWKPPARAETWHAREVYRRTPHLRTAGLVGAHIYVDCQTDDARLVLANVLDAESAGAVCAPYVEALSIDRSLTGHIRGVTLRDRESGASFTVPSSTVVSAAGPFTDSFLGGTPRLRPTLGVHLVVDAARLPTGGRAFLLRAPQDGRVFFVLPAGPRTVIGTTDTDWASAPPRPGDTIEARAADVHYLLTAANHAFPPAALEPADVISTFAGLRPLIRSHADDPSATSREHAIRVDHRGLLAIAGGKLTTMRSMGEDATDRLLDLLRARGFDAPVAPCSTRARPLPTTARDAALAALLATRPALATPLVPGLPATQADVVLAVRLEHARQIEDVLRRRTNVFRMAADQGLAAAATTADLMRAELGWSDDETSRALSRYRDAVAATRRWQHEA